MIVLIPSLKGWDGSRCDGLEIIMVLYLVQGRMIIMSLVNP